MIKVHHLDNSRSHRILSLLEELGLDYEIQIHPRNPSTHFATETLRAVHPLGSAPVIEDRDRVIAESGAIIEYILDEYGNGRLIPERGSDDYLRYKFYLHYAEGSLMPLLILLLVFTRMSKPPTPWLFRPLAWLVGQAGIKAIKPRLRRHLKFLESQLSEDQWFAGTAFTAADIQMSYSLECVEAFYPELGKDFPKLGAILERMRARPAYERAIERGGPLRFDAFQQ